MRERYTVENVVEQLKKLTKTDIPEEYRKWARDGIIFVEKCDDVDVQDFPNNIFGYMKTEPMPKDVRDLVEGILLQGIQDKSAKAACNLGALYYSGMIGEQSYEKARELYEMAADAGDLEALENLGECYYYGRDCATDYQKAYEYFTKGAFRGRIKSLYMIADMYRYGQYVDKDEEESYKILSHCIDLINGDSDLMDQYEPDVCIRYGEYWLHSIGCNEDPLGALYWAQRAEYGYRKRVRRNDPSAIDGIRRAVKLTGECRYILDQEIADPEDIWLLS